MELVWGTNSLLEAKATQKHERLKRRGKSPYFFDLKKKNYMVMYFRRWASTTPVFKAERPEEIVKLLGPIGQATKPFSQSNENVRTFQEIKADMTDLTKNRIRREELKKELAKSSFEDIYRFRHTGGKIFTAPLKPFDKSSALYMINIKGKLLGDSNAIGGTSLCQIMSSTSPTIIRLFSSSLGHQQIKQFTEGIDLKSIKLIDINAPTNWVNRLLVKWYGNSIYKNEVGSNGKMHKYLIANSIDPSDRKSIMAVNNLAGYLYVVDQDGKIRWATSGPVSGNEKNDMVELLDQLKK